MINLTNIFKVLSDETRMRIIVILMQKELCVCELCEILELPQSKVSRNLSKLRDMNLVTFERREKFIFYSLKLDNKILITIIKDILNDIEEHEILLEDQKKLIDIDKILVQCKY
ncbi:ArsR/SmtB family transcription factor [Helicovermis profundi]|uniref:Metalloregulator ArsR/SmtB family transcription factor n=1 Tax=Helicovermis profundi TaxID=3065157 RepID=A0AAU9E503_9FIRM|nr:metalloregulator ArsR/SmtB family transcription factor [Clostridia bacterium S502]